QVGNRAGGDRLCTLLEPAAQRLAASLLLLSPHLPLLFMGEEYGEERPFPFFCSFGDPQLVQNVREGRRREFAAFAWQGGVPDPQAGATFASARLSWAWPEGTAAARLGRLAADGVRAGRGRPALRDYATGAAGLAPDGGVLDVVRGGRRREAARPLWPAFNLPAEPRPLPEATAAAGQVLFASEAARYGGG